MISYIRLKQFLLNFDRVRFVKIIHTRKKSSEKGFTILEVIVASTLSIIVVGMALASTVANNRIFKYDQVRTRLNQNLRNSLDLLGVNLRQAGENFSNTFPAVEVINGTGGSPDELILRRNVLDEVLKLCLPITAATSVTLIEFANGGGDPGCNYSDNQFNYQSWQNHRQNNGNAVVGYIYDLGTKAGEFFTYTSEGETFPRRWIDTAAITWQNSYPVGTTAVYLLEEWHFRVNNNMLEITVNNDSATPLSIVDEVTDFQVMVHMLDGSTLDTFTINDDWTDTESIEIVLTNSATALGSEVKAEQTTRHFLRNVLSN